MPERYVTRHDAPLLGDVDLDEILVDVPSSYTVKGMFFTRYVAALGDEWRDLAPALDVAPAAGRYHAFEPYPMRDYLRVFDRVARARFPGSTREAHRLLARGEIEVFADSTLGKVTLSLLHDPGATLLRYPDVFAVLTRGPEVAATRRGPRAVEVTFPRFVGSRDHVVGLLEGLVLAFDEAPAVEVEIGEDRRMTLGVSW